MKHDGTPALKGMVRKKIPLRKLRVKTLLFDDQLELEGEAPAIFPGGYFKKTQKEPGKEQQK